MYIKDFKAIAKIIRRGEDNSWWIAKELAKYFATRNKHFNKDKFLQACLNKLED